MWYANPFTSGCSRASMNLTYVHNGKVYTATKGQLIKMTCDNWECPIPPVTDCYSNRDACAEDEWCMVLTHEKWGPWAMGQNGHTPDFHHCGEDYHREMLSAISQTNLDEATVEALKSTRQVLCGSSAVGVASGVRLVDGFSEGELWKPSHGKCVKYRQEGESCVPTQSTSGAFANAFVRREQLDASGVYPNGGSMERPLACAPGLVCTGPGFEVLPSTCVKARPADLCYAGPWWDSSRCPRTSPHHPGSGMTRDWALESLRSTLLLFPSEVSGPMHCSFWAGTLAPHVAKARHVTHAIFAALWPEHLIGPFPSLTEAEDSLWLEASRNLSATPAQECAEASEVEGSEIAEALAKVGALANRPNLVWSLIHFVMHNQPSPMPRRAVAASRALASHLSENFWCNDCRGFFTVGVLSVHGLPPETPDGEAHARYWNLGHNVASEHVATTRGGHPWITDLGGAASAGVGNPFFVPYETSVEMWRMEA